jgi:hypothetical protein
LIRDDDGTKLKGFRQKKWIQRLAEEIEIEKETSHRTAYEFYPVAADG